MLMLTSAVETGQMSAVETRQTSSAETGQMSTVATGRCPVSILYICLVLAEDVCLVATAGICPVSTADISISIQNQQSAYHGGCDSSRLDSKIPGGYITVGSRVMISKGYVSGLTVRFWADQRNAK